MHTTGGHHSGDRFHRRRLGSAAPALNASVFINVSSGVGEKLYTCVRVCVYVFMYVCKIYMYVYICIHIYTVCIYINVYLALQ